MCMSDRPQCKGTPLYLQPSSSKMPQLTDVRARTAPCTDSPVSGLLPIPELMPVAAWAGSLSLTQTIQSPLLSLELRVV